MISASVYLMCALTSILCVLLLYLNYLRNRTRLLLWSAVCFLGLAANNTLLFIDVMLTPHLDLSVVRIIPAVLGFAALIWGFVWDTL